MSTPKPTLPNPTRRGLVRAAAGLAAAAGSGLGLGGAARAEIEAGASGKTAPAGANAAEPFWGVNQGGIITPAQSHSYFAALDLTTTKRDDVVKLLRVWTTAAARMTAGSPAEPIGGKLTLPSPDSGEVLGLQPARLTVTFGFGADLFAKDGKDRYGLAAHRPAALAGLPRFNGDQLVATGTGGDLSVQACADDPQIAFHAVRQLARLAYGLAGMRWAQAGFLPGYPAKETPRNLMGFKDGTNRPRAR